MTDCRDAAGTPMDSTVGRGEAIGVPAASLRQTSDTVLRSGFDSHSLITVAHIHGSQRQPEP